MSARCTRMVRNMIRRRMQYDHLIEHRATTTETETGPPRTAIYGCHDRFLLTWLRRFNIIGIRYLLTRFLILWAGM